MSKVFTTLFVLVFFAFVGAVPAQFSRIPGPTSNPYKPFDFEKVFYYDNGIEMGNMIDRRTGTDGFSVLDKSPNPARFSDVRVLVTVPAYDQNGKMNQFWYPLGELNDNGFRADKIGYAARKAAGFFPIYVFPEARHDYFKFGTGRQAPVLDDSRIATINNPLGLRQVVLVYYTDKAFEPENEGLMLYYAKKNGWSTEDNPILTTVEDITFMFNKGLISTFTLPNGPSYPHGQYMVAPMIYNPTKGVIMKDAFIFMAEKNGVCLPTEELFEDMFDCLKNSGLWCHASDG